MQNRAKNHFKVVIPSYNNEKWIQACLRSVKNQKYDNFQCIIVDDGSTDNGCDIIESEIKKDSRFLFIKNKKQKLALRNIYEAIESSNPSDEDVIVTLDGDDWLASNNVLQKLNDTYNEKECWMTYGSYAEWPSKVRGAFAKQIPDFVIQSNLYRESPWMSSHMRTFKYKLWNKIDKKDLLEEDGRFCDGAWDMAFMFPMLEMSGPRGIFIKDMLYVYNRANPLNEDKVDHRRLLTSESKIRNKTKYKRIEDDI